VRALILVLAIVIVGAGALMLLRGLERLRRNRAFASTFWSSLPQYFSYRLRALKPLGQAVLGLTLLLAGIVILYIDIVGYYTSRLGHPASR